jgi:hypothetical protein
MNDINLSELLTPLVRRAFAEHAVNSIAIKDATDHDGDHIVDVRVTLAATDQRLDPEIKFGLTREILSELSKKGDERFPIVRILYPSDQPEENFYPESKPRRRASGR